MAKRPSDFETEPLKAFLENQESIAFELGSVSRFECPDYDVLKAEVISPDAQKLHYALKDKFKNSIQTTYPIYHAHATLAYVKKGSHKELDGHEGLKGEKFSVNSLLYSLPDKVGRKNLSLKTA